MAAKTYSRSSIAIFGFLIALCVFLFLGYQARSLAIKKLENQQEIVANTELVVCLNLIRLKMSEVEASALGYLATERRSYLQKLDEDNASIANLWSRIESLEFFPGKRENLRLLVLKQTKRKAFIDELIEVRRSKSLREAESILFMEQPKEAFDELVTSFSDYTARVYQEVMLLRERADYISQKESKKVLVGNICAFILLALGMNSLTRQIFFRGQAEDMVEVREKELDDARLMVEVYAEERDMAEESEKNLAIYNKQLKDKNNDLQRFATLASRDLSEPVSSIKNSYELLKTTLGSEDFNEEVVRHIDDIGKDASKMEQLLVSLKDYSRVNSKLNPFVEIHLDTVFKSAMFHFREEIKTNRVEVQADELGVIEGDLDQITQLFTHLLSNAIKFHRKGEATRISVKSENMTWESDSTNNVSKEVCCISVEDNGIGFNERFKEKIFAPFETLNTWHNYDSLGMGLSLSKRIVERHLGYIRAESEVGKWSRFIVVLPLKHNTKEAVINTNADEEDNKSTESKESTKSGLTDALVPCDEPSSRTESL